MPADSSTTRRNQLKTERFKELLHKLSADGITQREIAQRTGVPPQYITDVKSGTRNLSELFARRIADEFEIDFLWLLGERSAPRPRPGLPPQREGADRLLLPLLPHPVRGLPEESPDWDGSLIELCGPAAVAALNAQTPYVLRFGRDDIQGELQRGDLLLIGALPSPSSEISVIRYRSRCFLARRTADGNWQRVANGHGISGSAPVIGSCLGLLWRRLTSTDS
jgi:transcriptional regulator with XRE-family HTH domain